jgi:type VI secretion system protein ImpF
MSEALERYRTIPSVLNRLLGAGQEGDDYTLDRLREDIRRDIESFLNSRMPYLPLPKDRYPQLASSILLYGRPDLGTLKSEGELQRFARQIAESIKFFEPRFQSVDVELVGLPTPTDRSLKLRIKSTLRVERDQLIDFDSNVNLATGQCLLKIR